MTILIITRRDDRHAQAVRWGMRSLGISAATWYWEDFPKLDLGTLRIGPGLAPSYSLTFDGTRHTSPFDTIWIRRRGAPQPMAGCHPDDAAVVIDEAKSFIDNILPCLGHPATRWVNEIGIDSRKPTKTHQLAVAAQVGFAIPDTLISNDIDQVRAFFAHHQGRIIHKAFAPASWDNADGSRTTARTSAIRSEHLASEYAVRACPGIYQECIAKQFELRVTVMGDTVLCAAIRSQRDGATIDWRVDGGRGVTNLQAYAIEPALRERCLALCRQLGLAFGCIDLIVAEDGRIVFLEVNTSGQFLFKELADPSLPMLDAFCRYLAGAAASALPMLTMAAYQQSDAGRADAAEFAAMVARDRAPLRKAG